MANTYSQINIQCVFAVKGRENIICKSFRDDLLLPWFVAHETKYFKNCL